MIQPTSDARPHIGVENAGAEGLVDALNNLLPWEATDQTGPP